MIKASDFVLDAFWALLTRSLDNLGEDFSSPPKRPSDTADHEKPPLPVGILLMFLGLIVTGAFIAGLYLTIWYYFLGVVPTKMMVLSQNHDDTEELPKPRIWQLRRQISQFRFNVLALNNRELMQGALYVFFMFNWLSDIVAMPFSSAGLHKSIVYVLAAILLCPLQFIATSLSMKFPSLFSPPRVSLHGQSLEKGQNLEKGQKAPSPPSVEEPKPCMPTKDRFLSVLHYFLDFYRWLLPTTLLWAAACELAKLPPLALSRAYSLKDRAQSNDVLYALSGASLRSLILDSALVFLVYVGACVLLILPTTIVMRRTHASLKHLSNSVVPPDEPIRGRTVLGERKFLSGFEALRTFSSRQAARMALHYGVAYCVLQVIKSVGFAALVLWIKIMEDRYGFMEQYLGFWETLIWVCKRVVFWN
ncbi:hypothetical protein MMC07_008103 [Pseudocyphellaria aurata]|nr:hypothetical protein [Pseudocyphellaria aurata]